MNSATVSSMDMMMGGAGRSNAITVSDQLTRKPEVLDRLEVLAMGLHPRLGAQSPLRLLCPFVFKLLADELPGVECWGYDVTCVDGVLWVDEHVCRMRRKLVELCQHAKAGEGAVEAAEQCISDYRSGLRQYIVQYRKWWETPETSAVHFSQIWIVRALAQEMYTSLMTPDLALSVCLGRDLLACMEVWADKTWNKEACQDVENQHGEFLKAFCGGLNRRGGIVKTCKERETQRKRDINYGKILAEYYRKHGGMRLRLVALGEIPGGGPKAPPDSDVLFEKLARIMLMRREDDDKGGFFYAKTGGVCLDTGVGK